MSTIHLEGTIHGRSIELTADPGLADGQRVELALRPVPGNGNWGDGLRRCAGVLSDAWTTEDDQILAELQRERHTDRRADIAE